MALVCTACGREYAADDPRWRCACGGPLDYPDPHEPIEPEAIADVEETGGVWAFSEFVEAPSRVSLGEGCTPETRAGEWDAAFKLEYAAPSVSFKDRGTTAMVSRAVGLGVERVVVDSSGNAGHALAQYAAAAGLDAGVFVPADISDAKRAAMERLGADVTPVEGPRGNVREACVEAAEAGAWYASHAWRPSFLAGTETFGFEVAARRGWEAPDALVIPFATGTLLLGAYRGFRRLEAGGVIESVPRIYGAAAAGYAPVVEELGGDAAGDNTLVSHIADPPRKAGVVAAIRDTGGDAVAVTEAETRETLADLHRTGHYVEPTSAMGVAGLRAFRERGAIDGAEEVVVPLTGSGVKM